MVYDTQSIFVQVTVCPFEIVTVTGINAKFLISTVVPAAVGAAPPY
jgi:hypothetical protein